MKKRFTFIFTLLLTAFLSLPWSSKLMADELTVADGANTNQYIPFYGNYVDEYQRVQIVYAPSDMSEMSVLSGQAITGVKFYQNNSNAWSGAFTISMAEISDAGFSSTAWFTDVLTEVYSGTVTGGSTCTITFSDPYVYSGGNLLINIQTKTTSYNYKSTSFYGNTNIATVQPSAYGRNSSSVPSAPSTKTWFIPKTTFTYEAASSCKKPTALTQSAVTATSATFTWTAGASETSWQYVCLPAATAVDWNSANVQTTSSPSASVSGLSANTDYKFYLRADCGSEQSAELVNAFTTPCSSLDIGSGWSESFETTTAGSGNLPDCWSSVTYTYSNVVYPYVIASNASDGSKSLCFYGGTTSSTVYAILPPFVQDIKNLTISFDYKNGSMGSSWYPQQFSVGYVTNPNDMSTYTNIQTFDQKDTYFSTDEVVFPSSVPTTATNIVIRYSGNQTYALTSYIDNIQVSVQSSCAKPTGLTVTPASATSANVSWTAGGSETAWNLQYRVKGTSAWTAVNNVTSNSYTLIGLSANTTYEIQVQANCGGEQSGWTSSVEVHTPCAAVTSFPWTEDFTGIASDIIPDCWDNSASTCTPAWDNTEYYIWGTYASSGNTMLRLYSAYLNEDGVAVINSPLITLPNENDFEFLFDYSHKANCGAFTMKVSVDGAPFAPLGSYSNEAGTTSSYPGAWTTESISLASFANHTIQFQFSANPNYGNGAIFLDNFKVQKAPTCFKPTGLSVSNITSATADLAWTAGASEAAWVVQYKAEGASDWTEKDVSTTPSCSLTGLSASMTYYVQVKADCGAGDYSEPSAQQTFKTTCATESLPFEESFSSSTMPDCWIATSASTTYKWYMDYEYVSGAYNYYVRLRTGSSGTATLQLPPIDLSTDAVLKFKWKSSSSPVAPVKLYISTDGGTTKTLITPDDLTNTYSSWTDKTYDLSDYTGNTAIIYFISTFSATNKYAYLDDVQVIAKPCDLLTNVKVQPTMDGGTVTWTGDAKKLQYREGTAGAWTAVAIAEANKAKPHTLTDLSASTLYQVRALSICGDESDEAAWTAPVSFTTKCAPSSVLPYENDFEAETYNSGTLPDCWGKITTSTDYPQVAQSALAYGVGSGEKGNFLQFQGSEDQIAVLPAFTADLSTLTIQFFYRYHYADFQLGYVKADGATFVPIETLTQSAAYGEAPYEKDLAAIPADAVYLALRMTNASSLSAQACVDNLVIKQTPTCSKPTNLSVSAITAEGATFAWNVSEKATENQYQYCVVATGVAPSDWTLLGEDVRTVTITGKAAHTAYDFYVRSYCGSSDQSETVKLTFTTVCAVISALPWEHDFESDETFDIPECWDAIDNSGTSYVYGSNGHNAAKCLFMEEGRTTNFQTVILPKFDAELGTLYISFWYKGSAGANYGNVQVGYITDITNQNTFVAVGDPFAPASEYQNAEVPFTGITADARIAIRYAGGTSDGELYIDDIRVAEISACARPADLAAVATSDGAALTWSDDAASEWTVRYSIKDANSWTEVEHIAVTNHTLSGLATGTEYEAQVKAVCGVGSESDWSEKVLFTPVCNLPTDLTVVSTTQTSARITWESLESAWNLQYKAAADAGWTSVNNIAVKDYLLGGLTAGTAYQVRVQATCGGETFSAPVSFTTMCTPSDVLPYENDFESESVNLLPACWSKVPEAEYPKVLNGGASYGGEGKCLCFFGDSEQMVVLPAFTEPMANLNISFFYKNNTSSLEIGYVESDFVTFHKLADLANLAAYDANVFEMSLSAAPAEAASIAIRFVGTDAYTSQAYFDNLRVRKTPTCLKPTDLAVSSITANSASVSWTENGTAAAWNLQYKLASAADWTTVAITEKPYNLSGLAQGTNYKVRVQAACAGEELSDWSDEASFTTSCEAVTAIPYTETFDGALSNCWNVTDDETSVYAHNVYDGELRLPGGKAVSGHLVVLPEITASLANATMTIEYTATSGANTATPQVGYIDGESAFQELGTLSKSNSATKAFVALAAADGHRLALRYDDGTAEGDFNIREIRVSHVEIFEDVEGASDNQTRLEALNGQTLDIVLTRSVWRNGDYGTISLPFDLSAAQLADSKCPLNGFAIREYKESEVNTAGNIVDIYLQDVSEITAGDAYFVRYDGSLANLSPLHFRDVTVSSYEPNNTNDGNLSLFGLFNPLAVEANDYGTLFVGSGNALYYPNVAGYIKGFRAYFTVPTSSPLHAPIRNGAPIRISEQKNTPTGFENTEEGHSAQSVKIVENGQLFIIRNGVKYDAQGKKVQ